MKKKIIALGVILLAGVTAYGQDMDTKKKNMAAYHSIGPVAGFGHSWMSNMNGQQFKPSAHVGIGMIYAHDEHWGWGSELTASHEGYTSEFMYGGNMYRQSVDPVYIRYTPRAYYFFGKYGDNVRPKVYLGPSVAAKVQEDRYTTNLTMNNTDAIMGMPSNGQVFRTMDFGATGGAGVNVKLTKATWLNLDANYYQGLIDVTKSAPTNMNQNLRFNVGVMMGL